LPDGLEDVLAVVHQVHLVDGYQQLPDAEQRGEVAVPLRLGQHAAGGVDQDHRQIGGAGAGDHVPRVLLMPRGVRDDEPPAGGGEVAVGDVDGNALLALSSQSVGRQRPVDLGSGPTFAEASRIASSWFW